EAWLEGVSVEGHRGFHGLPGASELTALGRRGIVRWEKERMAHEITFVALRRLAIERHAKHPVLARGNGEWKREAQDDRGDDAFSLTVRQGIDDLRLLESRIAMAARIRGDVGADRSRGRDI